MPSNERPVCLLALVDQQDGWTLLWTLGDLSGGVLRGPHSDRWKTDTVTITQLVTPTPTRYLLAGLACLPFGCPGLSVSLITIVRK